MQRKKEVLFRRKIKNSSKKPKAKQNLFSTPYFHGRYYQENIVQLTSTSKIQIC